MYGEQFEAFWLAYPARLTKGGSRTKGNKRKAGELFAKLTEADAVLVMPALQRYSSSKQMPMDAVRWLRDREWESWPPVSEFTCTVASVCDDDLDGLATEDIGPRGATA